MRVAVGYADTVGSTAFPTNTVRWPSQEQFRYVCEVWLSWPSAQDERPRNILRSDCTLSSVRVFNIFLLIQFINVHLYTHWSLALVLNVCSKYSLVVRTTKRWDTVERSKFSRLLTVIHLICTWITLDIKSRQVLSWDLFLDLLLENRSWKYKNRKRTSFFLHYST